MQMTIPNCDDCGHPADVHTVEKGCLYCECPSLLVISDDEASRHLDRLSYYQSWLASFGPRWSRRRRLHRVSIVR